MWQILPGNDSGASGLVSAEGGTFLVVNEDTFWEVTLEPLASQHLDFRIDGAVELEAICAIPWSRGHFFTLEKNSGRVTQISRAGPTVIQQFHLTKQPGEILECLDCALLGGKKVMAWGHRGGATAGRLYWTTLDSDTPSAQVSTLDVSAPFEPLEGLEIRHLSDFKISPNGELWAVANRNEPLTGFRTLVWRVGSFSDDLTFQPAPLVAYASHEDRKAEGLEFHGGRMLLVADNEGGAEILNVPDPRPSAPLDLAEVKRKVKELEPSLSEAPWQVLHTFQRNGRFLVVALTDRLRKSARKAGLWNSKEMAATLKNAAYGLEPEQTRSAGGRDGIYRIDRDYRPENEMMRKLFGRFLDKAEGDSLASNLETPKSDLLPVRLVSHHMRLLGVLRKGQESDFLVLVDCDNT